MRSLKRQRLAVGIKAEGKEERYVDMDGEPLGPEQPVAVYEPTERASYETWEDRLIALASDEWIEMIFGAERVEDEGELAADEEAVASCADGL